MNIKLQNKAFEMDAQIIKDEVYVKIEHKGRYQKFVFLPLADWKKMTPKRYMEILRYFVTVAPINRVTNLLSYKTAAATYKFQSKLS